MRVEGQACPVLWLESRRVFGERRIQRHGLITREHAATQETLARGVGGELIVAVQISIANALPEPLHDALGLTEFDDTPDFDARPEFELDACDESEQSVPANHQAEQFRIRMARAREHIAVGVEQVE